MIDPDILNQLTKALRRETIRDICRYHLDKSLELLGGESQGIFIYYDKENDITVRLSVGYGDNIPTPQENNKIAIKLLKSGLKQLQLSLGKK